MVRLIPWFNPIFGTVIVASVVYFLFVYIPMRDHLQAQAAADSANARLEADCVIQADRATQQYRGELQRQLLPGRQMSATFSDHHNRRLKKCLVQIEEGVTGPGYSTFITHLLDAYERRELLTCSAMYRDGEPPPPNRTCFDGPKTMIPEAEFEKRLASLTRE